MTDLTNLLVTMVRGDTLRPLLVVVALLGISGLAPAITAQRRVEPTVNLRIDGEREALSMVMSLAVGADGTIAVSQFQDGSIRFFSAAGRPVRTFGRQGEGPGEFRVLSRIGSAGGRYWGLDDALRRTTYLTAAGALDTTLLHPVATSLGGRAGESPFVGPSVQVPRRTGGWIVVANMISGRGWPASLPGPKGVGSAVLALNEMGEVERVVGWKPAANCGVALGGTDRAISLTRPFCAHPMARASDDGERVLFLTPDDRGRAEVHLMSAQGDTGFAKLLTPPIVRVSPRVADSTRDALVARASDPAIKAAYRSAKFTMPQVYPAFRNAIIGRDGTVWLQRWFTGMQGEWLVLDARGEELFVVVLPRSIEPLVVSRDTLWGVEATSEGSQNVVRMAISR